MKRTLLAAALLAATGAANAVVTWVPSAAVTRTEIFNNITGLPTFAVGSGLTTGDLFVASGAYRLTFTYLGEESGFSDKFHLVVNGTTLTEASGVGAQVGAVVLGPGFPDFKFEGDVGKFAINGGAKHPAASIGLIGTGMTVASGAAAGTYDFVLGYNDSAGAATLGDWDDFVVGVTVTAVPEPETYALMLAGLGIMGFVARRRRAD